MLPLLAGVCVPSTKVAEFTKIVGTARACTCPATLERQKEEFLELFHTRTIWTENPSMWGYYIRDYVGSMLVGMVLIVYVTMTVLVFVSLGTSVRRAAHRADQHTTTTFFAAAAATLTSQTIAVEGADSKEVPAARNVLAGRHDFGELDDLPCAALVMEVSAVDNGGIVDTGCGFAGCTLGVDTNAGTLKITAMDAPQAQDVGPQFDGAQIQLSNYRIEHCAELTSRAQSRRYAAASIVTIAVVEIAYVAIMAMAIRGVQINTWARVVELEPSFAMRVAIWVSNTRPPSQTNTCFRRVCSSKVECSCFAR